MEESVHRTERLVKGEKKEEGNTIIAVIVGVLLFLVLMIILFGFDLTLTLKIIFVIIIIAFYIIVLSFLFEKRWIKEIIDTITQVDERVVEKEVIKKVDRPVIYEVPRPIIHDVIKPVDRLVVMKREKLNIPKYDYVGSNQTMNFHKNNCRLSKLIKKKYKILNNDYKYFIKNGYSPCKVCILKEKKV
jgi:hypothetical protein